MLGTCPHDSRSSLNVGTWAAAMCGRPCGAIACLPSPRLATCLQQPLSVHNVQPKKRTPLITISSQGSECAPFGLAAYLRQLQVHHGFVVLVIARDLHERLVAEACRIADDSPSLSGKRLRVGHTGDAGQRRLRIPGSQVRQPGRGPAAATTIAIHRSNTKATLSCSR